MAVRSASVRSPGLGTLKRVGFVHRRGGGNVGAEKEIRGVAVAGDGDRHAVAGASSVVRVRTREGAGDPASAGAARHEAQRSSTVGPRMDLQPLAVRVELYVGVEVVGGVGWPLVGEGTVWLRTRAHIDQRGQQVSAPIGGAARPGIGKIFQQPAGQGKIGGHLPDVGDVVALGWKAVGERKGC